MSKCTLRSLNDDGLRKHGTLPLSLGELEASVESEAEPSVIEPEEYKLAEFEGTAQVIETSPLRRALRLHFQNYSGLSAPRERDSAAGAMV